MTTNLVLVVLVGVLVTAGIYLLLERSLTRVLLGVLLLGNAINLLLVLSGGPPGGAPIVGTTPVDEMSDPLPQALVLTAIVIMLAVAAFVLTVIYRGWQLDLEDDVVDDEADRAVARRAALDERDGDDA